MATRTKEAIISVRLTAREKGNLDADVRMKGLPAGTAAAAYISEGVRRSQFPAVEFRNGSPGRVAYLVGSRWPVWMMIQLMRFVMFSSGPLDFCYAPHHQVASTVMNMTFSLTPLRVGGAWILHPRLHGTAQSGGIRGGCTGGGMHTMV